jgi:hypothetical protein
MAQQNDCRHANRILSLLAHNRSLTHENQVIGQLVQSELRQTGVEVPWQSALVWHSTQNPPIAVSQYGSELGQSPIVAHLRAQAPRIVLQYSATV